MTRATNNPFSARLRTTGMSDLLLLHGLTFGRRTWEPLLEELGPGRKVLAVDLPGHGTAPRRETYPLDEVAEIVHDQVTVAGLTDPVVVGHSIGAVIATAYAAAYPATAVLNLDQILLPGPFGTTVREAEPVLRSPDWRQFWNRMLAGMGIASLPDEAGNLVETATEPRQDLLLGYWGEILYRSDAEIEEERRWQLRTIAARGIGYHWVTANEPPAPYLRWLRSHLPESKVTVWPGSHFPHLADPAGIARMLADQRSDTPRGAAPAPLG